MDSQNDASTNASLVGDGKYKPEGLEQQPRNKKADTNEIPNAAEEKVPDEELLSGSKLYIVLLAVTIVAYLTTLDSSIVATAIPQITNQFHSLPDVGWYGSAYLISTCAFQPSTGKIYANYSLKYTYMSFLAVFELGSLICGVAQSSNMLIIGRAISGIGGSGMTNGALTILATVAAKEKQPMLIAFCMSIAMLGIVSGPLLGGVITEYSSWRWCFFINLPAGAVTVTLLFFSHIPNNNNNSTETKSSFKSSLNRLDPIGFVLFAPTCVMLLLALEWGGTTNYAWDSATVIGLFCGAGGMLTIFLLWEYKRGDTAMIPLTMLRKTIVYCSCLTTASIFGGLQTFSYYMPIWFQTVQNASPSMSGVNYVPSIGSMIIASMITGALISKIGRYTPFAVLGSIISSIGAGLLTTLHPSSRRATWIGYQILAGAGRGMAMQQPITAVQQFLPRSQVAVGTTLIIFSQYFGAALIIAFAQTIFSNSLGPALKTWAPGVSKELVVSVGATAVRTVVTAEELPGVLRAYNQALMHTLYLGTAFTVVSFFTSWGLGWGSIKKKDADTEAQVKA